MIRNQVEVERDGVVNLTHPSAAFVLRTIPPSRKLVCAETACLNSNNMDMKMNIKE